MLANNFILSGTGPTERRQRRNSNSNLENLADDSNAKDSPKPFIEELLDGACAALQSSLNIAGLAFGTIPTMELSKNGDLRFYNLPNNVNLLIAQQIDQNHAFTQI